MNPSEILSSYGFADDSIDVLGPALLGEPSTLGWPSNPQGVLAAAQQMLSTAQSALQSFSAHQRQTAASPNTGDRCNGYDTSYWGWLVNAGLNAIQASSLAGQFGGAAQSADATVQQWASRMSADPQFQTSRDPNGDYFDCIDVAWVDDLTSLINEAQVAVQAAESIYRSASAPNPQNPGTPIHFRPISLLGDGAPVPAGVDLSNYGLTQSTDGSWTFDGDSLVSKAEQQAVGSLGDAFADAIREEAEFAGVAASFMAGLVGAEAGITAAAGGATIASAVAAGELAGQAAAATVGASLATGPAAPLLILGLAIVAAEGGDIVAFFDGFDPFGGHEQCCGDPPAPTPIGNETKDEAIKRATQYAYSKNSDASCPGNHTITQYVGAMPGMPADGVIVPIVPGDDPQLSGFTNATNQLLYKYINEVGLTKCWPLTQRASTGHMLAMSLSAWNQVHEGPAVTLTRTFRPGVGPYVDLIGLALDWGSSQWMTDQGQGYLGSVLPGTSAIIHLSVNVGPLKAAGGTTTSGGASSTSTGTKVAVGVSVVGVLATLIWWAMGKPAPLDLLKELLK